MDNLTHSLVGLVAAKAGLERLSPGATVVCLLTANAPDSDIAFLFTGGRWAFLQHHRGITHSIVGTLCLGLIIPLIFYLGDLAISKRRKLAPTTKLHGLVVASLIVSATHPLMDWTNSYGIRLFLPWSPTWSYGDLVFIVDPFMWLVLGGAAFLVTSRNKKQRVVWALLGISLTYLVMSAGSGRLGSAGLAWVRGLWLAALVLILVLYRLRVVEGLATRVALTAFAVLMVYWGGLAVLHGIALERSVILAASIASWHGERVLETATMPTLANPLRWQTVFETELAAYRFDVLLLGEPQPNAQTTRYERVDAPTSPAVGEALKDPRVRIFLGFARFPVVRVVDANCTTRALVQLADLRYTEPGSQRGTFALEVPVECSTKAAEAASP